MKIFMVKTVSLIAVLLFAVIFGMIVAKNNMVQMQGIHQEQPKQLLDLNINFPKDNHKQTAVKGQSIDEKVAKLAKIKTFNPYAKMGSAFSSFLQSVFRKGISDTSQGLKHVVNSIINS